MEILLIHPGALGDILLALPAVELLRREYPEARITLAADRDHAAGLLKGSVDDVIALSSLPLQRVYGGGAGLQQDVRFWRSYNLIVSWTGGGDPGFVENFRRIHPKVVVSSWRPQPDEKRHVSQIFADSLDSVIRSKNISPFRFPVDGVLRGKASKWLAERGVDDSSVLAVLHPGAGSKTKRWPPAGFIAVARHLIQDRKKVVIVEGPAEPGLAHEIAGSLPAGEAFVAEALPLPILAALIGRSSIFVGNDSGIAHLSAALGVPSIVLFGPTLPRHWAPLGSHVTVLRNADGCNACLEGAGSHTCLTAITVDEVMRAVAGSGLL